MLPKLYYMKVVASKKYNFRFYQIDLLSAFWQQKYKSLTKHNLGRRWQKMYVYPRLIFLLDS